MAKSNPHFTNNQAPFKEKVKLVKLLLPKVSRTFALNIKVLKEKDYLIIATAYLICRYLDSIEDSPIIKTEQKIAWLEQIAKTFKTPPDEKWVRFFDNLHPLKKISNYHYENLLWQKFAIIIELFLSFDKKHQDILIPPIIRMTEGMKYFITKYKNSKNKCLKNEEELEKYCYFVAGTVGEMLTDFFALKIHDASTLATLHQYKNNFALGLQMTNILKDLFQDKKRDWIYLPEENIKKNNLTIDEFFSYNLKNREKILSIYHELIKKTNINLEKALIYTLSIPKKLVRYRIFCLIPLLLAVKTSSFLKKSKNIQKSSKKISKQQVFIIVFFSFLVVFSNFFIKKYFKSLK